MDLILKEDGFALQIDGSSDQPQLMIPALPWQGREN